MNILGIRRSTTRVALAAAAAASIMLTAGCAVPGLFADGKGAGSSQAKPVEETQAAPADAANPEPEEEIWVRYTDPRTPGSFEVPPGWEVREGEGSAPEYDVVSLEIFDEFGTKQLSYLRVVGGVGGACGPVPGLDVREVDAAPFTGNGYVPYPGATTPGATIAQVSYRVVPEDSGAGAWGTVALSDSGPNGTCFYYNFLNDERGRILFADVMQVDRGGSGGKARHFDSIEEAYAFVDTELYAKLKRVLLSFELNW